MTITDVGIALTAEGYENFHIFLTASGTVQRARILQLIFADSSTHKILPTGEALFIFRNFQNWSDAKAECAGMEQFLNTLDADDYLFIKAGKNYSEYSKSGKYTNNVFNLSVKFSISCNIS